MTYIPTRDSALLNDLTRNTYRAMTHAELVEALIKRDIKIEELQHEKSASVQAEREACEREALDVSEEEGDKYFRAGARSVARRIHARNAQEEQAK